jgi:3-oxoacyl-[acyl-carrier-protein] synthase II
MIAVTGMGLVCPHGDEPESVFAAILRGESAVREVAGNSGKPVAVATSAFDETRWFNRLQLTGVDRVSQFAVAAAQMALTDAGFASLPDPERTGVYGACGMGGAAALETAYLAGARGGRTPPLTIPAFMPNAPAAHIAMRLGVQGPVLTYAIACAASAVAIAEAAKAIEAGDLDMAIAGGSEALIVPGVLQAWDAMHTLARFEEGGAPQACRPFAIDRSGFALGEGAAFLILEPLEGASRRGARIYAYLAGSGISCDAVHLTKPDAAGQTRALRAALRSADLEPSAIGYCNAHGTATSLGDVVESEALAAVWGADLGDLPVSSTKSMHGHLLGAAGALEAALTVMALYHRQLPPNAHCVAQDPLCRIALVREPGTVAPTLEAAISSSFAFGGTNAVLVFRRAV